MRILTMCPAFDRWRYSFANFFTDMGVRHPGMTLDRKNPFGDYQPNNCKWSTGEEQSLNKRGSVAISILEYLKRKGHGDLLQEAFTVMFETSHACPDGSISVA
jgi:hypothetical protein